MKIKTTSYLTAAWLVLALLISSACGGTDPSIASGGEASAAPAAAFSGAEGTATLNADTWSFEYAVAYQQASDVDESKTDTWVVLSEEPIDLAAVEGSGAMTFVQLALDRQIAIVRLQICREGCSFMASEHPWAAAAQVFSPSRAGFSMVPDRFIDLELEADPSSGRVQGRVSTAELVDLQGDMWSCDLRFGADISAGQPPQSPQS